MGVGTHLGAISGVHAPQEEGSRPPRRVRQLERLRSKGRERNDRHPEGGARVTGRRYHTAKGAEKGHPTQPLNGMRPKMAHAPEGAMRDGIWEVSRHQGRCGGDRRSRRRVPPLPAALCAVGVGGILG